MASELIKSIGHNDEIYELLKYIIKKEDPTQLYRSIEHCPSKDDKTYTDFMCYHLLGLTSRSFARVIQELSTELKDAVCIFYLVLRGLDTIEDDMTLPVEKKTKLLNEFYTYIYEKGWTFTESGPNEKDRVLLEQFDIVIEKFLSLKPSYQKIIERTCKDMGKGMAEFCSEDKPSTMENYYQYTYIVAGLVGLGLSDLFSESGLEDPELADKKALSDSMGRFLQKTNIIRDFLEDYNDGRKFWPNEAWKQFIPEDTEGDIGILLKELYHYPAMATLNYLCIDAFQHVIDVLDYLSLLKDSTVFNFCAIPQLMAIATLSMVFNNPEIFTKSGLKIRKGETVKLMNNNPDIASVINSFVNYITIIENKAEPLKYFPLEKENYKKLMELIKQIKIWVEKNSARFDLENRMRKIQNREVIIEIVISSVMFLIVGNLIYFIMMAYSSSQVQKQ